MAQAGRAGEYRRISAPSDELRVGPGTDPAARGECCRVSSRRRARHLKTRYAERCRSEEQVRAERDARPPIFAAATGVATRTPRSLP